MITTDALAHVAHKSTVESRMKNLDLRDIEYLSCASGAQWLSGRESRLFGQSECWRIYFKQNLVVTSRADGLKTELTTQHFTQQFLAAWAPHFFAIGFAHRVSRFSGQ